MASQNDSFLNSNNYDTNSINNCNNNESEISTSSSSITNNHHQQQQFHHNYNNHGSSISTSTVSTTTQQKCDILSTTKNLIDRNYGGEDTGTGDCRNIRATTNSTSTLSGHQVEQQTRREENPFSFKHFLNRDTSNSTTSNNMNSNLMFTNSTMMMTTAITNSNESNSNNSTNNNCSSDNQMNDRSSVTTTLSTKTTSTTTAVSMNTTTTVSSSSTSSTSYKTSTGARPKVPQSSNLNNTSNIGSNYNYLPSSSISTTSMSSLIGGSAGGSSAMKRSPRFSSFDSQASLAEYAGSGLNGGNNSNGGLGNYRDAVGEFDNSIVKDRETTSSMSNFFKQSGGNDNTGSNNCNLIEDSRQQQKQQYVHRSFSNYDMDLPPPSSLKNCINSNDNGFTSPRRRNSPTRSTNRSNSSGIPQSSNKNYSGGVVSGCSRPPNSEFPNVLPDFVQDHWMDQWYYNDMNLSSPPNSPISPSPVDFVEDLPSVIGGGNGGNGILGNNSGLGSGNLSNNTDSKCQALPDFLSDGPIIHSSSARLADVAAGLPPDLDSPEDNSPSLQLSRLRLENERLRRELDESRLALAEQTRRAGELERRLEQFNRSNKEVTGAAAAALGGVCGRNLSSQNLNATAATAENYDENLDQSKKRAAAAQSQSQVVKLKQQVKQLTAEVEALRRENESLREDGAVGGDRVTRRPSINQQLSRDLMRAAANAENNLRQLLSGVENLRLMASTIENMDRIATDSTNQLHSTFNDECVSDSDVDNFNGL